MLAAGRAPRANQAVRELTKLLLHQKDSYAAIGCGEYECAGAGPAHVDDVAAAEILDEQAAVAAEIVADNTHLAVAHSVSGVPVRQD